MVLCEGHGGLAMRFLQLHCLYLQGGFLMSFSGCGLCWDDGGVLVNQQCNNCRGFSCGLPTLPLCLDALLAGLCEGRHLELMPLCFFCRCAACAPGDPHPGL